METSPSKPNPAPAPAQSVTWPPPPDCVLPQQRGQEPLKPHDPTDISYASYLDLNQVVYSTGRPIAQHPDNKIHPEAGTRPLLHHEEFLFRRIHQSIEILFSQVIHDLTLARDLLGDRAPDGTTRRQPHHVPEADIPRIIDLVDRSTLIMRHLRGHLDILGTMTPQQFLVFRDQLQPASGFQSTQFIEIELLLGLRHNDLLPRVPKDTFPPQMERFLAGLQDRLTPKEATELAELRRVGPRERLIQKLNGMYIERFSKEQLEAMQEQVNKQSLVQALEDWLERTPVERAYPDFVRKFVSVVAESQESSLRGIENAEAKKQRAAAHLTSLCDFLGYDRTTDTLHATPEYRMNRALLFIIQFSNEPLLAAPNKLIDSIMQFDTSVREFRYAHARLVELQLGRKVGGTGSDGVTYLDETAPQTAVGRLTMARTFGVNPYILGDRPPSFQELAFRIDQEAEAATLDPYAGDHPARK